MIKQGKTKKIKVSDLIPYDNNPVIHSPEQIAKIKNSLEKYGYRSKIGCDKNNIIVYGHCRHSALLQINPNLTIDVDDLSDLPPKDLQGLRIIDNSLKSKTINETILVNELEKIYPNLQDNLANIENEMDIDVADLLQNIAGDKAPKRKKRSRHSSVKLAKIILEYQREDYQRINEMCEQIQDETSINSKSDLFLYLLEERCRL